MQKNNLHKLGKTDLLTIIYKQEKQIQQLTNEVEDLKNKLDDRTIQINEAGSIAEASLKINKIFEVAQQAADEYLKSIKEVNKPSQEYAQVNDFTTKEHLIKDTYENRTNDRYSNKNNQKTEEKISKELVLVNNKIMEVKPKLLKRVVILLLFIFLKIINIIKKVANETVFFVKELKLDCKIYSIKLKCSSIKFVKTTYDMLKNHMIGFVKYCKLNINITISKFNYKCYVFRKKVKLVSINLLRNCISKFKKICNLIYLFGLKIIKHLQGFIGYCSLQITLFKFKIRIIKSRKKKLLSQSFEVEKKEDNRSLITVNAKWQNIRNLLIKTKKMFIKLYSKISYKLRVYFKKFYEYITSRFEIVKIKVLSKLHNVKRLNKTNKQVYIEKNLKKDKNIKEKKEIRNKKIKLQKYIQNTKILNMQKYITKKINSIYVICKKHLNKVKNIKICIFRMCKDLLVKLKDNIQIKKILKPKHKDKNNNIENIEISIQQLEEELKKRKEKKVKIRFIKTLGYSAMVIVAFAIITSTSFFKILQVSGSSMEPNLHEGELLITSTFFKFDKGDIIAFYYNDSVLIKRVIATEGDVVNIEDDGTVFVNSVRLEEEYVKKLDYGNCDITFPYQVPKNSVFILGDNREVSIDSRSKALGCIANDKIIGKIKFKLNPFVIY